MEDSYFCRRCGIERKGPPQVEPFIADVWEKKPHGGHGRLSLRRELVELGAMSPPDCVRSLRSMDGDEPA